MTCRSRSLPAPAIAWVVLCAMLVVLGAHVVSSMYQDPSGPFVDVDAIPTRSVHPKIDVNGNAQLSTVVDRGSGTESDPYIIENRIINAGGIDSAIAIRHTTAHLVIRNCTVFNSGAEGGFGLGGITLQNVQNAKIVGSSSNNNQQIGILLRECQGITVEASNVTNNQFGIAFFNSTSIIISRNRAVSNQLGIFSHMSRDITITWNMVSDNTIVGVAQYYSNSCSVLRNQFNNVANADSIGGYNNTWDDGARGNYWADYETRYPFATHNQVAWNTPYSIGSVMDNFPLVNPPAWDVPGQVTGLVAVRGKDHVNVSWTAPTGSELPVTGYVVCWSLDNVTFAAIPVGNVTSYQHPLDYRQACYYKVVAVNALGEGPSSHVTSIFPGFEVVMYWITGNVPLVVVGGIAVLQLVIIVKLAKARLVPRKKKARPAKNA